MRARSSDDPTPTTSSRSPKSSRGRSGVLRRGLAESPELRRGLWFTVVVSLGVTVSTLVTPVLVQQVFDHGFDPAFRPAFVYSRCAASAIVLVALAFVAARAAGRRLVSAAEAALMRPARADLRHIHALSIAEQSEEKRGVFVARVTADVDALQQFMEWGGIAWIISRALLVGALVLMLVYSWQLALAVRRAGDPDAGVVVGDAGAPVGRVQHGAHPGGRDALGGLARA